MKLTCWFDKYAANLANLPTSYVSYLVPETEEKKQKQNKTTASLNIYNW